MLLPLPTYLKAGRDIESLPRGEGTIINSGPLALRKVGAGQGWLTRLAVGGWYKCTLHNVVRVVPVSRLFMPGILGCWDFDVWEASSGRSLSEDGVCYACC